MNDQVPVPFDMRPLAFSRRAFSYTSSVAVRPNAWSAEALRRLRELAQSGATVAMIAAALDRSESAIRNKAGMHGISLTRAASRGGLMRNGDRLVPENQ